MISAIVGTSQLLQESNDPILASASPLWEAFANVGWGICVTSEPPWRAPPIVAALS
jgi:hypothetical protein